MTPEDIEAEYWAYHYLEEAPSEEYEDEDWDLDKILATDDWETVIDERSG